MVELNPFDDLIVKEPRHRETAVAGLNEKPLHTLLARAEQLPRAHVAVEPLTLT